MTVREVGSEVGPRLNTAIFKLVVHIWSGRPGRGVMAPRQNKLELVHGHVLSGTRLNQERQTPNLEIS